LLLGATDRALGLVRRFAGVFRLLRADRALPETNSWRGARPIGSTSCSAWPATTACSAIADDLAAGEVTSLERGAPARRFADFAWRTFDSWGRERRMVAQAEHLPKGSNPRFVVTSLPASVIAAGTLCEDLYCARGEVENPINEQLGRRNRGWGPVPQPGGQPICSPIAPPPRPCASTRSGLWFAPPSPMC
jgi:hypothetical protein